MTKQLDKLKGEFVSDDNKKYKFKIGREHASSLSGFIAGAVLASIIWLAVAILMKLL